MRYRLMATYQGQPYEAGIGPSEGDVVLFAACPPPEELGFEPATGHWRKQLRVHDVQALWESRPTGTFRGEPCIILDDLGDRLHIAFLGHDAYQAEKLGYWQVDRGVFELITPHDEVLDVVEERTDYPHRPDYPSRPDYPNRPAAAGPAPFSAPAAAPAISAAIPHGRSPATPASGFGPTAAASGLSPAPPGPGLSPAPPGPGFSPPAAAPASSTVIPAPGRARPSGRTPPPAVPPPAAPLPAAPPPAATPTPAGTTLPGRAPLPARTSPSRPGSAPAADTGPALTPYAAPAPAHETRPGVAVPPYAEPPLPLEAAALRATSAAARQQPLKPGPPAPRPASRRRRTVPGPQATERIFSELANQAAIPAASYAVGAEVEGAMCLMQTETGFEVFNAAGGARHEARRFDDEESAYFYLFGVLAAEAVRTGSLVPPGYPAAHGAE